MTLLYTFFALAVGASLTISIFPVILRLTFRMLGATVKDKTRQRRELLLSKIAEARSSSESSGRSDPKKAPSSTSLDEEWEKIDKGDELKPNVGKRADMLDFDGIVGFFHPFCNAGGGGERVLFAAILAVQHRYPHALCVVYTGDHDANKGQILTNARTRFNITLDPGRISFLYLSTREWVLPSKWPRFTLLGQSIGSLFLAWDAFNLLVPDIFIDTMGYAFTLALCKRLFPNVPTGAYVHYPTISTDMLSSLHDQSGAHGVNAGLGKGVRGRVKQWYWKLFAWLYSWVGGHVDIVMTNSTWTERHISSLWEASRSRSNKRDAISVVWPPCAVEELQQSIPVNATSEANRSRKILYIAQFRPEKMHQTVIEAFATFLKRTNEKLFFVEPTDKPKLILAGSVRDDHDEKLVYKLRLQAHELDDSVEFVINAKWPQILELLRTSSIGVNGMWNEHFGIGVVEYQAAGLISVVNDSGGPKEDIVVLIDGEPTGKLTVH